MKLHPPINLTKAKVREDIWHNARFHISYMKIIKPPAYADVSRMISANTSSSLITVNTLDRYITV